FAVGLVLVLGLWCAGAPAKVRNAMLDRRRIEDLHAASDAVTRFHLANHRYPTSLGEIHHWGPSRVPFRERDPVSNAPYEFEIADSTTFRLCAPFDAPDSIRPFEPNVVDPFWAHGAGHACFTFHIPAHPE